jgi:hypothetical protein
MNISTDEKFDESLFKKEELKILNEVYKIY